MTEQYKNFGQTSLAANITAAATTLTVSSAVNLPATGTFHIVVGQIDSNGNLLIPPAGNAEIMLVTAISGTTLTVTRAQESTAAVSHSLGEVVANVLTAGVIASLSSGGGTAAGPLNAVQYNSPLGTFAGSANFLFDGTKATLTNSYTGQSPSGAPFVINNSSASGQNIISLQTQTVAKGQFRSDFTGNMNYAAYSPGVHFFWVGGDYPSGNNVAQIGITSFFDGGGIQTTGSGGLILSDGLESPGIKDTVTSSNTVTLGDWSGIASNTAFIIDINLQQYSFAGSSNLVFGNPLYVDTGGVLQTAAFSGSNKILATATGTLTSGGIAVWDVNGNLIAGGAGKLTATSANAFAVGQNGTTNPAFNVDTSIASSVTGITVQSAASGGGVTLQTTSSAAAEKMFVLAKGAQVLSLGATATGGQINMYLGGTTICSYIFSQISFTPQATSTASTIRFATTAQNDTNLTTAVEAPWAYFNMAATRQHATGTIALQRDFRVTPSTHSFVAASTLTQAAAFALDGPPPGGTNATITTSSGLLISAGAVTNTTNAYGEIINAPTGASGINAAALFNGDAYASTRLIVGKNSDPIGSGFSFVSYNTTGNATAAFVNTSTYSAGGGAGMVGIADNGSAITSGSRLAFLFFNGAQDNAHTYYYSAGIEGVATENFSGTTGGSKLIFSTTANGTQTRSTVLTLDNDKSATFTGNILTSASVKCTVAGGGLYVKQGTNGLAGTIAFTAGVATISISGLVAADIAQVTLLSGAGTLGSQYKAVCTSGTLTITSTALGNTTQTLDTSTVQYVITKAA